MAFDLEKFNAQVYTALTETVDQQVEVFNAASEGTLVLAPSNANMGDFAIRASFQLIAGLVRRRDANNGTDPIATARLLQLKNASVKVAAGLRPLPLNLLSTAGLSAIPMNLPWWSVNSLRWPPFRIR